MKLLPWSPVALAATAAALIGPGAQAQIYRSVDAQGQVTFTDTPGAETGAVSPARAQAPVAAGTSATALPYDLRQIQARYPVTLYAGAQCAPCDLGRSLLTGRGIPFAEKTIASAQDIAALRQLSGSTELPVLAVGGKQIQGYAQDSWAQYLDAAGYPATSQLPAGWQPAPPTPLAAPTPTPPTADASTGTQDSAPRAAAPAENRAESFAPVRTADNPAGIRF